jgi:hypothetical protein
MEETTFLSAREAAQRLGVTKNAIWNAQREGRLPCIKRHGILLFHPAAIRAYALRTRGTEGIKPRGRPRDQGYKPTHFKVLCERQITERRYISVFTSDVTRAMDQPPPGWTAVDAYEVPRDYSHVWLRLKDGSRHATYWNGETYRFQDRALAHGPSSPDIAGWEYMSEEEIMALGNTEGSEI